MNQIYVKFWSEKIDSPEYIGPFTTQSDADDYADEQNYRLSLAGIPSWVANYSISD